MTHTKCIQVVFCGPDGAKKDGPLIITSRDSPFRLDHEDWDKDRSIHEFRTFLECRDSHGIEAAMHALDRHDCWHEALGQFLGEPGLNKALGECLLWLWISYGFHVARSLKDDLILVDVLKHLLPPYGGTGLTLYRGELYSRHQERTYGISWTRDPQVAKMFADRRRPDEGLGIIVTIDASPEMIVVSPNQRSLCLREVEYIVDWRLIQEVCVFP